MIEEKADTDSKIEVGGKNTPGVLVGVKSSFTTKAIIGCLIILGVAIIGFYSFSYLSNRSLYGKVGSTKITKVEVQKLTQNAKPYTTQQIGDTLMDRAFYKEVGHELNISVSSEEVLQELHNRTKQTDPYGRQYLEIAVERDLLLDKIKKNQTGGIQGKAIIIHFDQHFNVLGDTALRPGESETLRGQYISQDRAHADALKDDIYDQLTKGKISFDEAMKLEKDDKYLGTQALPTSFHSQAFDTADEKTLLYNFFQQASMKKLLEDTAQNTISKPTIIGLTTSDKDTALRDGLWVITLVDKKQLQKSSSFDDFIFKKKQSMHYRKI